MQENTTEMDNQILSLLNEMKPISLDEMSSIRLMNRLDTKYVASKQQLVQLLGLLKDKYYVQQIKDMRICPYRTTYFDTEDHKMYMQHHNKHANRLKVRVRTYLSDGDLTFLEVKRKNNKKRTKKKRMEVESLEGCARTEGAEEFLRKKTKGMEFKDLHPVVQNYFQRITLVNYGKTERLTIDFNVQFTNFETGLYRDTDNLVIIELKRDGNIFSPVCSILRDIHVHPSGFSKCCIGMALTDKSLKQNNFKERLHYIERVNGRTLDVDRREAANS